MRFKGGCVMLLREEGEQVEFVGTAFLVHPEGYLLTAAHVVPEKGSLIVSPSHYGTEFATTDNKTVPTLHARVVRVDKEHDVALLGFKRDAEIAMPDHVIGSPEDTLPGTSVACLGYSYGFFHVYSQCIYQAVATAKVHSPSGMKFFMFDAVGGEGLRGGPLVDVLDGRIIGIVGGRFYPSQLSGQEPEGAPASTVSYAISIDYGAELLRQEGLEVL